ncbi:hypothetical protein BgAZ_204210 [Babesia gibsoni]|uniref:Uncharacterized protein n=1 Tax=Babesia gibsoni TaxID=33632 RepID=A0AAD8LT09_BABGI|nr:hypothetical protein BgAZ_204210 [Babesia gibsoni]
MALRPFLRKPKVRNRTTREEKKRRSAFHKQLHKELRMKYWERLSPEVNTVIEYKPEVKETIDPKRSFVVQEAIPELVKLDEKQIKCSLTPEQSEAFDRPAGLVLLCDIKAVFGLIADIFNNDEQYKDFMLMVSQDQVEKQKSDVEYLLSLLQLREEPAISPAVAEYCAHIDELAKSAPIKFLAHVLYIYKDWHLTRRNFLALFRAHLKLVRRMRSASFDNDCDTLEKTLNKAATKWSRWEKDTFIEELATAQQMAQRALTYSITNPFIASQSVTQLISAQHA